MLKIEMIYFNFVPAELVQDVGLLITKSMLMMGRVLNQEIDKFTETNKMQVF